MQVILGGKNGMVVIVSSWEFGLFHPDLGDKFQPTYVLRGFIIAHQLPT